MKYCQPEGQHCQGSLKNGGAGLVPTGATGTGSDQCPALGISSIPSSPYPMPKKEDFNRSETRATAELRCPGRLLQPAFLPCVHRMAARQLLGN